LGRVDGDLEKVRRYGELRYAATSWKVERRVIARRVASHDAGWLVHGRDRVRRGAGQ
jgi:hypothetical protein